jgi:DNA-binding Lrp family transcriptional regulator
MVEERQESYDRAVARLALGYALKSMHRAAEATEGDLLDGVIRIAIGDANTRHMRENPELAWTYAAMDRPVPDDMRHPVSINAIAMSLNLPFETTRRRVAKMVKRGLCIRSPKGLRISTAIEFAPRLTEIIAGNFEDLRRLRRDLRALAPGLTLEPETDIAGARSRLTNEEPYRAALRASMSFMLRFVEPISTLAGDLLDGIILLSISHANTLHVASDPVLTRLYASKETPIPDHELRAIAVQSLARTLNLSFETTRRRVRALEAVHLVARRPEGVIVPSAVSDSPAMQHVRTATCGHLQRMYTELWRLGVQFD